MYLFPKLEAEILTLFFSKDDSGPPRDDTVNFASPNVLNDVKIGIRWSSQVKENMGDIEVH